MGRQHRWMGWGACSLAGALLALGGAIAAPASAATIPITVGAVKTIAGNVDPTSLACPAGKSVTATTCEVLGSTSTASTATAVTNSNPKSPAVNLLGGTAVGCISATTCVVVGASSGEVGQLQWIVNGHVAKTVLLHKSSYLNGVTCGINSCIVVGELYGPVTKNGTVTYGVIAQVTEAQSAPTATRVAGVASLQAVACASPTSCYAVGSTTGTTTGVAVIVPFSKGKPGARVLAGGSDALDRISCGTATSCWATGTNYSAKTGVKTSIVPITKGKPGARLYGPENGGAIACINAVTCFFASGTSQYGKGVVDELTNGKVVRSVTIAKFAYGTLSAISCPTASACLATGATGFHNPGPNYYYTGAVVTLHI